jgi:agmatinase
MTRHTFPKPLMFALCLGMLSIGAESFADNDILPSPLVEKISDLSPKQQDFILKGHALKFLSKKQLVHEIKTRDSDEILAFVSDLISLAEQMSYDSTRDMGAIPLNLNARTFNHGIIVPRPLQDSKRAPGPFSLQRYMFEKSGISTFAGAKYAMYPQDLIAGDVDIAFVGIPSDMSSGRRNARSAPMHMRMLNTIGTIDKQSLVDPMQVLSVVDYGDISPDNWASELSLAHIQQMIAETASTGALPFVVGGDTSILYPVVAGIVRNNGNKSIGLLHFSAHPDVDIEAVQTISDQQVVSKLIIDGVLKGKDIIHVGMRGNDVNTDSLARMRDMGIRYHTMAQLNDDDFESVFKKIKREVRKGPKRWFISVDVSVLRPSDMIAAGRTMAGGMSVDELVNAVRYLCSANDILGFEITDVAPMLDLSRRSIINANEVLNACLVGVAVRKAKLKPDYVHPLALKNGQ